MSFASKKAINQNKEKIKYLKFNLHKTIQKKYNIFSFKL